MLKQKKTVILVLLFWGPCIWPSSAISSAALTTKIAGPICQRIQEILRGSAGAAKQFGDEAVGQFHSDQLNSASGELEQMMASGEKFNDENVNRANAFLQSEAARCKQDDVGARARCEQDRRQARKLIQNAVNERNKARRQRLSFLGKVISDTGTGVIGGLWGAAFGAAAAPAGPAVAIPTAFLTGHQIGTYYSPRMDNLVASWGFVQPNAVGPGFDPAEASRAMAGDKQSALAGQSIGAEMDGGGISNCGENPSEPDVANCRKKLIHNFMNLCQTRRHVNEKLNKDCTTFENLVADGSAYSAEQESNEFRNELIQGYSETSGNDRSYQGY